MQSRAVVRAPFDGRVLGRAVAVGQSITSSTALATIFNTDFVEVRLPIASRQLAFLQLPEHQDDPPVNVELSDALNEEIATIWQGQIIGTEGALDSNSRELFAIARVEDPFSRQVSAEERAKRAPLRIGQPVRAAIDGKVLEDVFIVPRTAVRNLKRIYIVDGEKHMWQMHEIDPIWESLDNLIIRDPTIPSPALLATTRQTYSPNIARIEILPDTAVKGEPADGDTAKPGGAKDPS